MPAHIRFRGKHGGGVVGYPLESLFKEVAYLAYYFHWPHESIMNMDHRHRLEWVGELGDINEAINNE